MQNNETLIIGAILLAIAEIGVFVLVGFDKLAADLAMTAVVSPIVGGIIGFAAGQKGVQAGAKAAKPPHA